MALVLFLHPGEGLLAVGGLTLDLPLGLSTLSLLGAGPEGVLGGEILGVNLVSAKGLLEGLDELAEGIVLLLDVGLHLEGGLVGLLGTGVLGLGVELVLHLSLLAPGSVLELLLDLDLHLLLLLVLLLGSLELDFVVGFNAEIDLLLWGASLEDGFLDGL